MKSSGTLLAWLISRAVERLPSLLDTTEEERKENDCPWDFPCIYRLAAVHRGPFYPGLGAVKIIRAYPQTAVLISKRGARI